MPGSPRCEARPASDDSQNLVSNSADRGFQPIADACPRWHEGEMKEWLHFIAALGGLISVSAQAQVDTRIDAIREMHDVAHCVVYNDSSASSILGVAPGSTAEYALLRRLASRRCAGAVYDLTYSPQLLRGAIAEEVLRLGDNNRSDGRRMRWAAPFPTLTEADIAGLDERGRASLQALDFAQCIHAAAPASVQMLLNTFPTEAPEERAFQELAPHFGPCLQAGARMTIAKPQLRGFLAEASYRAAYVSAQRPANQGGE